MFVTDKIWKILKPATEVGENTTREELEEGLKKGFLQMFIEKNSVAITASYSDVLRIGLAGGNLNNLKKIEKKIIKYAKNKNYKSVDILGRVGWEKSLKGYKRKAILLRKELL